MQVGVLRWCAWAPGLEDEAAWRAFARQPHAPKRERRAPPVDFVPALQRRRCDDVARMLLHVARGCAELEELGAIPIVLASRHGPFETTVELLEHIAEEKPLSPTGFSHSVHNTALGLFSIWSGNRSASVALAAGRDTFAQGFVEALALLHRTRREEVLYVCADEAVPEPLAALADRDGGHCALALRLARGRGERSVRLRIGAGDPAGEPLREWSDPLEFLRWWLGDARELEIARGVRRFTWTRVAGAPCS
jgi:hypothetical protein